MAKRKHTSLRKTLKPGQYVRVRLQSGKFTKFRSGRNLIFEIVEKKIPLGRNGKPKKGAKPKLAVVGYMNKVNKKTKKPEPRSYTAVQFRFLSTKVTRRSVKPKALASSVTIRFNNRSLIVDQLLMKKGEPLKKLIRSFKLPLVTVYSRLFTSRGDQLAGPGVVVAPSSPWEQTAKIIAMNLVFGPLQESAIRMSPKKYQKEKTNQMRWVDVTFTVSEVPKN